MLKPPTTSGVPFGPRCWIAFLMHALAMLALSRIDAVLFVSWPRRMLLAPV